jgi:hypothetical protein
MSKKIIAIAAALSALAACDGSLTRPSATEADFGNSVASMREAQTANPAKAANPGTAPVTGVDPDYAGNVIEVLRESVSKPAEIQQPITIQVGGQQGGN